MWSGDSLSDHQDESDQEVGGGGEQVRERHVVGVLFVVKYERLVEVEAGKQHRLLHPALNTETHGSPYRHRKLSLLMLLEGAMSSVQIT